MAQQTVGVGTTANDGTGDTPRNTGQKINANFTELYAAIASLTSSLAGKANTSHTQTVSTLSDATTDAKVLLQTYDNTDFASSAHTHELSDVDELVAALASKYDSSHVGTTANKLVQLTAAAKLPAVDGSLLTDVVPASHTQAVATLSDASSDARAFLQAADNAAMRTALEAADKFVLNNERKNYHFIRKIQDETRFRN